MKSKTDPKTIVARAKDKGNRAKVSFTLDGDVYETFQKVCEKEEVAMSRVLEELITDFLEGLKKS